MTTNTSTMAYFPCSAAQGRACSDDHATGMDGDHINAMQIVDGMAGKTRTHNSSHLRPQHLSTDPNYYINVEEENSTTKPDNCNNNSSSEKKNNRKKCRGKKNKQPQRGLGVAQLEKLRLQERWNRMTDIPPSAAAGGFQHNDPHQFMGGDDNILSVDRFGSSLPWIGGGPSTTGYYSTSLPVPRDITKMMMTNPPIHPHCSRSAEYIARDPCNYDGSRRRNTTTTTTTSCCCTWAYRCCCCSSVAPLAGNNQNDVSKASSRSFFPSELSSNQNQHFHYYCSYYHSTDHFHDFKMVGVNGEINNGGTADSRCSYSGRENLNNHLFSVGHNIGSTCHKTTANHDLLEMAEEDGSTRNMNTDTEEVQGVMIKEYELFPCNDKFGNSGEGNLGTSRIFPPPVPKSENTTSTLIDLTLRLS